MIAMTSNAATIFVSLRASLQSTGMRPASGIRARSIASGGAETAISAWCTRRRRIAHGYDAALTATVTSAVGGLSESSEMAS
jgi:hypothetical protein